MRNFTRLNLHLLSQQLSAFPAETQAKAKQVLALEPEILKRCRRIYERPLDATRIRLHGDYHLGKLLYTGKDFFIVDFEGNTSVPISERRLKRSPLQDVASMVLSFHFAAYTALLKHVERGTPLEGQLQQMLLWARFWARWVGAIFFKSYLQAAGKSPFLPSSDTDRQMMMEVFLLQKMISELGSDASNRPDWVKIPLQEIVESIGLEGAKEGTKDSTKESAK
jgi:maltose alpha-D-glucosyltransferase/alpha-amylase